MSKIDFASMTNKASARFGVRGLGMRVQFAVVGAAMLLASALSASAATTFTGTDIGTIGSGGVDTNGLFGAPGTDLTGVSYKVVATFETSLTDTAAGVPQIYGGAFNNAPSLGLTIIKINGVTRTIDGVGASSFTAHSEPGFSLVRFRSLNSDNLESIIFLLKDFSDDNPYPGDVFTPLSGNYCQPGNCNNAQSAYFYGLGTPAEEGLNLEATDYTVTAVTSTAPEPGTWAMMLVGFAGMGAAMRSRRKQAMTAN